MARKQILNASLDKLADLFEYGHLSASTNPSAFIEDVIREITTLRALLDKYGGHTDECACSLYSCAPKRKCDCGFDEAMKGLGVTP